MATPLFKALLKQKAQTARKKEPSDKLGSFANIISKSKFTPKPLNKHRVTASKPANRQASKPAKPQGKT